LDTINYIMYIIIAALLSLCVLSIYIFINESAITGNVKRNLTSEYDYAHFSAVDHSNYLFTPSLLLCHPQRFTLNAGESIWIPRKWWHWVRTQGPSTAVNFWMPLTIGSSQIPFMITDVKQPPELLNAIESVTNTRESWNSRIDIIVPKDKISNDNEYVITLEGYIPNKRFDKLNSKILEVAKHHANIPPGAELNVWISEGYHDTGLHYDDKDGILTVLSGKKELTLYPPTDTSYLRPLDIVPAWAKQPASKVYYNLYHFDKYLPKTAYPSARILYESIHNKAVLREITKMKQEVKTPLVWGCKWQDGVMRWEIYAYHFDIHNNSYNNPNLEGFRLKEKTPCLIHSIDLLDRDDPIGSDIHYYHKTSEGSNFPIFGKGTTGLEIPESIFCIDTQDQMRIHFKTHLEKIGFRDLEICSVLLDKYSCKQIAVWNKYKDQIYVQYYGISLSDFIHFLKEHRYPKKLIDHVSTHDYNEIEHEITIVYDLNTLKPIRTGFYGIL
jgi:hypothetical protein